MTDEQQNRIGNAQVSMGENDAVARTEIPLRIIVLGDFAPEMPEVADWSVSSLLLNVTPSSFSRVMQQLKPSLTLDVPNRINNKPKTLTIQLNFSDMKAFRPEGIIQQVKELADLLEIRKLVSQLKDQKLTLPEFDERIQQTGADPEWLERFHQMLSEKASPPAKPIPEIPDELSPLDSLLAKMDMGDDQQTPVDDFIGAIIQPKRGGQKPDSSATATVIAELDRTLSEQVDEILHHEKFQQLESRWRGLKFLVDRTDFRENIRIELLSVHKDDLRDAVYQNIFPQEYNELTEMPLSMMIADHEFDQTPEDMELLGDMAQMSASIHVPFIASVGLAFFGVETAVELADLPMLRSYFKRPEYAKWNALRDNEDSQYIALVMPRFLLRLPYGPDGKRVKGFDFTENAASSKEHLWGRGVFAVAAAIVRSFAASGWSTQIMGLNSGGMVENLPVWTHHTAGKDVHIPLEVSMPQNREREFMDNGFALLSSRINDDKAYVMGAPTIHRPKKYTVEEETEQAQLHATMPYQLFATRVTHYLRRIVQEVSTGLTAEQVQRALEGKLQLILAKSRDELPPDAVTVEVSDNKEQSDYYNVALHIKPPFQILGRSVKLLLGLQLHR